MIAFPARLLSFFLLMSLSLFAGDEGKIEKNQTFSFLQTLVISEYEELEDGSEKVSWFLEIDGVQVPVKDTKKLSKFEHQMVNVEGKGNKINDKWTLITKVTKVEAATESEVSSDDDETMPF